MNSPAIQVFIHSEQEALISIITAEIEQNFPMAHESVLTTELLVTHRSEH